MSRAFFISTATAVLLAACAAQTPADAYALTDLVADLEAAGVEAPEAGSIEQDFFSTTGRRFNFDGQEVQVFEYAAEAARQTESELIQVDGSPNPTTMVTWIDQPNFWARGRLIVLYVGRQAATIERLSSALGQPLTEPWPGG